MNSISLINKVKYNKSFYSVYNKIGSIAIKLLRCFVRPKEYLIVFSCFGGRKYDDSPKAIFEQMIRDKRFDKYELVWAFIYPKKYRLQRAKVIRIDTLRYYKTLLQARVWVTNSGMTRGLSFWGKNTFLLNTWHGTPIKLMGIDKTKNRNNKKTGRNEYADIMLAQGAYEVDVFSKAFGIEKDNFRKIGLPRNDELYNNDNKDYKDVLKKQFNISSDKKVILYAPTFREFERDKDENCVLLPPINIMKWKQELADNYVLLFRAHYEVVKNMDIVDDDFVINVSNYPHLNDLMLVSDLLISDYSSIFFDYSILGRPMLCFAYDFDEYAKKRGLYFDIREELSCRSIIDEDSLLEYIKSLNYIDQSKVTIDFREKYVQVYGNASQQSLDVILQAIQNG